MTTKVTGLQAGQFGVRTAAGVTDIFTLHKCPDWHPGPKQPPFHLAPRVLFPAIKRPGHEANLHLVRRLRMSGAVPHLPLYTFMVCIRTVSPFDFFYRIYL